MQRWLERSPTVNPSKCRRFPRGNQPPRLIVQIGRAAWAGPDLVAGANGVEPPAQTPSGAARTGLSRRDDFFPRLQATRTTGSFLFDARSTGRTCAIDRGCHAVSPERDPRPRPLTAAPTGHKRPAPRKILLGPGIDPKDQGACDAGRHGKPAFDDSAVRRNAARIEIPARGDTLRARRGDAGRRRV